MKIRKRKYLPFCGNEAVTTMSLLLFSSHEKKRISLKCWCAFYIIYFDIFCLFFFGIFFNRKTVNNVGIFFAHRTHEIACAHWEEKALFGVQMRVRLLFLFRSTTQSTCCRWFCSARAFFIIFVTEFSFSFLSLRLTLLFLFIRLLTALAFVRM